MNSPLTSRDIAAMTARAAAIKAENDAHTQGRLRAGRPICGHEVERSRLFNSENTMVAMAFSTTVAKSEADARRLAACWNACIGIPTEVIEQRGACERCSGSGEDPEGFYDQSRGDAGHTHDGPCRTCGGSGWIGGPSYYSPDEGGEPCTDCAPAPSIPAEAARIGAGLDSDSLEQGEVL